ncbi:MAG: hypothetical protein KKG84_02350, partial [Candidatus Omnitrophica bacterium]|nr:hypothetical protein [Candidatus Omnitrophota bacterium]
EEKRDGKEEIGTVITGKRKKIGEIDRYIKIVSSDGAFLEPGIPAVSVPGPHMGPVSAGPMFSGPGSALPLKAAITPEEMLASVGKWYTPGPRFMPAPPKIKVNIPAAQKEKEDDISARNEEQITLEWKKLDDLDEDLLGSNAKEIYRKVIGFARNIDDEKHPIGRGTLYKVLFSSLMAESDHGYVIKVIDTAARRVTPAEVDRYKEELIAGPIEAKRHKAETTLIFSKKIIELYFFAKCMDPENIKKITDGKVSFFESVSDELFGAARGMECLNAVYARIENGLNGLKEVISEMQEAIIEDFYAQKEYKTVVSRAEVYLAYLGHEKRFSEDPEEARRTEESIERTKKRLSAAEKEISGPQENRLRDKIRNEISAKKEVQISGALTGRLLGIIGKMFELEDPELFRELTADIADNVSPSPKAFRTVLCSAQMTKKMMISRFFKKMSFESFANVIRNAWRNSAGDLDGQKISPFADDEQKAFLFMNRMDVLRGVSKEQGNYVGASIWTLYKCLYSALYTSKEYKYMIEHYENSVQALPKLKEKLGEDFKYLAEMQELNTTVSDEEYQKKDKELKEKTEKYNDLEAFVHILQFVTVEKYLNIYFLARFLSMSKGEIANIPAGKNAFVVSAADDLYGKGNGLSKIEEYYKGGDGIKRLEKYIFGKEYGVEGLIDLYIRTERYGEASDLLGLYVTYLMKMKTFYGEEKNDNALKNTAQKISEMNTLRKKIAEGKEAFERALEEEVDARIEKIKKDERKAAEARDKKREMAALRKKERKEKTEPKRAQKDTAREAAKAAKKEKEKKIKIKKALAEAEEALAKDDPDRAQKQCEFVLRMDPGNEDAGKMMSAIEKERKRKEYLEALKMIPGHFSDAENALSEERFEAVIPPCRAILEVSPANKEANKILITAANKAFDLNLLDRAKQLCEFLMSDVCGTGDREGEAYYREAEDMLGDIRDIEKTFTINQMISSARTLLDEKNFNAALTRTETIIKKFPEDTEAPALLEEIKERAKKHNEKENKRKIAEFLIQAREAFEKGKYGAALILADEILGLDPENREAADILDISKMYIEASEAREKADATVDKESLGVALLVARTKEMTLLLNKTGRENIKKKVQAILRIAENENSSDGEKAAARAALLDLGYRSKDQVAFLTGLSEQPGQQVFVKAMAAAALLRHGVDPEKQVELLEQLVQGYIDTGMINNEIESAGRAYRGAVEKHIELQREINSKKRILIKDRKALERSQQNVKFQEEKIKEAEKLGTVLNGDVSAEAVARNALADAGINSDENGFWIEKRYMPLTKLMKERSFIDTAAASLLEGALFAGHGLPDRGWLLDKKRSEKDIISDLSALETSGTAFEPARIIASLALDKYRAVSLKEMPEEAQKAGMEVDTHPNTRYTLIVPTEFFANGEYVKHKEKIFGDRFDLEMIGAQNPAKYVNRILRDANGNTRKKIALVPDRTSEEHLKRLTNQDIRFIRMDFEKLIENKSLPAKERETFQINTYVIMMLTRALRKDENGKVSPSVRRTLEFYLMSHFGLSDIEPDKYIEAILEGNIAVLIKGILLSRPIAQYDMPDYHLIAAALIRA